MPFPTSDRWYVTEYEPAAIMDMRRPLCLHFGRPNAAFGCRGDTNHYSGYHRSRNFIVSSPYSSQRLNDYSIQDSLDTSQSDWNMCCAFDFVPGEWGSTDNRNKMKAITNRLFQAAKARDPRLGALREIAGTLNGTSVTRFRCSDGLILSPFDSSHLDHIHGSFWRSRAKWNHSGILAVIIGSQTSVNVGDDMLWFSSLGNQVYLCNGMQSRKIDSAQFEIIKARANNEGLGALWKNGLVRSNWDPNLDGPVVADLKLTPEQMTALQTAMTEAAGAAGVLTEQQVEDAAFRGAQRAEDG